MSRESTSLVSIVIPTCNRASCLERAIDSVLAQTFTNYELIIIDDGSIDNTATLVADYQRSYSNIKYHFQENAGGPSARNKGWRKSSANYILFFDSDDLLQENALETLWCSALANPDAGLVGGSFHYMDAQGQLLGQVSSLDGTLSIDLNTLLFTCPFVIGATLVRKEWLHKVGGFDTEQVAAQDWDLWLRMAAAGCKMVRFEKSLLCYRQHDGNLTRDFQRQKKGALQMLDKFFESQYVSIDHQDHRNEIYASTYTYTAAREYGAGHIEMAKKDLALAGMLVPIWVSSGILIERLLRLGTAPAITLDQQSYMDTVLNNLPPEIGTPVSRRRAKSRLAAAKYFENYKRQEWDKMGSLWWTMIRYDLRWALNPGVWSIGLRYLIKRMDRPIR